MARTKDVAEITVKSDGTQIYVTLHPQGDEAVGADIVDALRNLADAIEFKVENLRFAIQA